MSDPHQPGTLPAPTRPTSSGAPRSPRCSARRCVRPTATPWSPRPKDANASDAVLGQLRRLPEGQGVHQRVQDVAHHSGWAPSSSGSDMPSMKEPSPEAVANVTEENIARSHLLPEEKAAEGDLDPARGGLDPRCRPR